MAAPAITVYFRSNTSGLNKGFKDADAGASSFGTSLKSVAKMGALAAGAAGVGALVVTLKAGISEYMEASKVAAQTNAAIKSTGGVANVTAKEVSTLAEELMRKSGVDDEAIASGENLLLTFTNVRDEVGKGNDIFKQATAAALDMSVALGTDMKSSAMQLGKALNDPVAGMTKLQRSGVTFTDSQKELVKTMVESGDVMGAQKVILGELNKEFGGSAEAIGNTLPGQINILKESFNNLAGVVVGKLMPSFIEVVTWINQNWPAMAKSIEKATKDLTPTLVALMALIKEVKVVIAANWGTIGPIVKVFSDTVSAGLRTIQAAIKLVTALLRGDWSEAWNQAKKVAHAALEGVVALTKLMTTPLRLAINALWQVVTKATSEAWEDVTETVRGAVNSIAGIIRGAIGGISRAVQAVVDAIKKPINAVLSLWNRLSFTIPTIPIPEVTILGKKIGGGSFGGQTFGVQQIPLLAQGGIVTRPTLAMVGEAGPEMVIPLSGSTAPIEVRVFIGDQELTHIVRTEIVDANTGLARTLLAGGRA